MGLSILNLFHSFPMQINICIDEIWNTSTKVEKVDKLIVKVEVKRIRHPELPC